MNKLPSKQVLDTPEILLWIFGYLDTPSLWKASLVCRDWHQRSITFLWRHLIVPRDWFCRDISCLSSALDRHGNILKTLSLELSSSSRLIQNVNLPQILDRLQNILSRAPNLECLKVQVPEEVDSSLLSIVAKCSSQMRHLDCDIRKWDPNDMVLLLKACPHLTHVGGHNFSGKMLECIAQNQSCLQKIDCTRPLFEDEDLIAFAEALPDLIQLSVHMSQCLTDKALTGVSRYYSKIECLNFHICLGLQSSGFQAILGVVSCSLRDLDLGVTAVCDVDVSLVAAHCPKLESLKLPFCSNISEFSIRLIVMSCPSLLHLDISFCHNVMLSVFDMDVPWACQRLLHLDISGINGSHDDRESVCPSLTAMYHQLGLLTELRCLKMSGYGLDLQMLTLGRVHLSKLGRLEMFDISGLWNPLPWQDIVEIGNLFPRLKDLEFRNADLIPLSLPTPGLSESAANPLDMGLRSGSEGWTLENSSKLQCVAGADNATRGTTIPEAHTPILRTSLISGLELTFFLNEDDR
ncbi:hypothetical protein BGZ94_008709 [Podila epigama]|nr:hypothetical protein BGZ94_008709 [Podila epigama]